MLRAKNWRRYEETALVELGLIAVRKHVSPLQELTCQMALT